MLSVDKPCRLQTKVLSQGVPPCVNLAQHGAAWVMTCFLLASQEQEFEIFYIPCKEEGGAGVSV
jgi:hypothetical protein